MQISDEHLETVARGIAQGRILPSPIETSLDGFRRLYEANLLANDRRVPRLLLINLGDRVVAAFPEQSPQEIIVLATEGIDTQDFSFAPLKQWLGPTHRQQGFLAFLGEEVRTNPFRFGLTLAASLSFLLLAGPSPQFLDLLNVLLVQAGTVFLSIYLIFTVAQTDRLSRDRRLFVSGTLSRYYSHDRNITLFGIATIAFVFLNTAISFIPAVRVGLLAPNATLLAKSVVATTSAIAVTMLFHTFFIVARYYLERTRDLAERDHIGAIIAEEYAKSHSDPTPNPETQDGAS